MENPNFIVTYPPTDDDKEFGSTLMTIPKAKQNIVVALRTFANCMH